MGAWKFIDVFGKPLVEMDDSLIQDLTTLRILNGIAETIKRKASVGRHSGED